MTPRNALTQSPCSLLKHVSTSETLSGSTESIKKERVCLDISQKYNFTLPAPSMILTVTHVDFNVDVVLWTLSTQSCFEHANTFDFDIMKFKKLFQKCLNQYQTRLYLFRLLSSANACHVISVNVFMEFLQTPVASKCFLKGIFRDPGGTGIAGLVIKLGKVVCVSRVYRYSISLRI